MKQILRLKLFSDTKIDDTGFNIRVNDYLLDCSMRNVTNSTKLMKLMKKKLDELEAGDYQIVVYLNKFDSSMAILNLINLFTFADTPLLFEVNCKTANKYFQFTIPVYNQEYMNNKDNTKYISRTTSYINKLGNSYGVDDTSLFSEVH